MEGFVRKRDTGDQSITVSLSGPEELVLRMLRGMAEAIDAARPTPGVDVAPFFLSRAEAARRSGLSKEQLSAFLHRGELHNHGAPRRMLFSLDEIRALQQTAGGGRHDF